MHSKTSVVIGSGIAGLLAARVLADHFQKVVLIDRDDIPTEPFVRNGVPQGHHVHTLLPGGLDVLTELFPDLEASLDTFGGRTAGPSEWYALTQHGKTYRISRLQPTPITGNPHMRIQTRALLEHCIRRAIERLPNVEVRYSSMVVAPLEQDRSVVGVRLDGGQLIEADLTVDASGRVSRTLRWLAELGYQQPAESVVNCDFAYTSMFYRPDDIECFTDAGFLVPSAREGDYVKRGGSLVRVEGDRWLVTLAGRLGDHPPNDLDGFVAYVETLQHPELKQLLAMATPMGEPHQYKFPKSVNRHFEQLTEFPEGLLPIGDALCHINPGYAQGMSSACREAQVLAELLRRATDAGQPPISIWRDYFEQVHQQTRAPWLFAAMTDFSKDGTTGDFPEAEAAVISELKRLSKLADSGDLNAAKLVDSIFDMQLPLSAIEHGASARPMT